MKEASFIIAAAVQAELEQCLQVLEQEFAQQEIEVIVVEAASRSYAAAFNDGARQAESDTLLFMRAASIFFLPVYRQLRKCLWQDDKIAAVGPLTNQSFYGQTLCTDDYEDYQELRSFCYNLCEEAQVVSPTMRLQDFCLMVKRSAYQQVGGFDERFTGASYMADADLCLRLIKNGGQPVRVNNAYVYQNSIHEDSNAETQIKDYRAGREQFVTKWDIRPEYSFFVRQELLQFVPMNQEQLCVLEAGCACGSNLMTIKYQNPASELYGIELEEAAASIAGQYAQIYNLDLEGFSTESWQDKFDVVIMGDILEHLRDPWKTVARMYNILKPGGKIIISVPNITHVSIFRRMLAGHWDYEDAGILDRTHLRFFARAEVLSLLENAGFMVSDIGYTQTALTDKDRALLPTLTAMLEQTADPGQLKAYQWVAVAVKR